MVRFSDLFELYKNLNYAAGLRGGHITYSCLRCDHVIAMLTVAFLCPMQDSGGCFLCPKQEIIQGGEPNRGHTKRQLQF